MTKDKSTSKIKIVIADDEPVTKMDLNELLSTAGYDVVALAADGFDAIEQCGKHHPDLALLDIRMPYLDGLSAAKIIYEENLAGSVILLTAYSDMEFVEQAKESGVDGYLVKPIDEKSLVPSIEMAVSRSKEMNRLRKDIEKANERLESRVIVEKAKGLIMMRERVSEQEAYEYLRKISQLKKLSIRRVAELIMVKKEI